MLTELPFEIEALLAINQNRPEKEILHKIYDLVTRHFISSRPLTYIKPWRVFRKDLVKVWQEGGFCHCFQQNSLIKQALLTSRAFSESDIKLKWGLIDLISPHQWLQVRINGKWTDIDPWGRNFGIPFGKNASGFVASWKRSWVEEII